MKFAYIHQYFATNAGTTGTRSYDVSAYLVEAGHRVVVITGWSPQSGLERPARFVPSERRVVDGIDVVVCNVEYSNHQGVPARLFSWAAFAAMATVATLREPDLDAMFVTSTPLTVAIPARVVNLLRGLPYLFEVRDLWPEDLLAAGRLRPGLELEVWAWLERLAYARATRILLVSKGFEDRLRQRGYAPERLRTLVLGADGSLYQRVEPARAFLAAHGLADKVVAVYAGAHGDANGLGQVLDAAERTRHRTELAYLLIGDGKAREALRADAARRGLSNVVFAPAVPKQDLPGVLVACDIGLLILKQISRPRWVTPNKLFDYLFAGLPTVVNFAGTSAELVTDEGVGVAPSPGSADALAEALLRLVDQPAERRELGARARALAFARFERRRVAAEIAGELERAVHLARGTRPAPAPDGAATEAGSA